MRAQARGRRDAGLVRVPERGRWRLLSRRLHSRAALDLRNTTTGSRLTAPASCVSAALNQPFRVRRFPSAIVTNRIALPLFSPHLDRALRPTRPPSALLAVSELFTAFRQSDGLVRADAPSEMRMRSLVLVMSVLVCCRGCDDHGPESDGHGSCSRPCGRQACRRRRSRRGRHDAPDGCGRHDDHRHGRPVRSTSPC